MRLMRGLRPWSLGFQRAPRPIPLVRQLVSITAIIRWVGLVVAGIIGVVAPPRASLWFVLLILAVGVYNASFMLAARRSDDVAIVRIARLGAVFDQLGCLVFLTIFTGLPGGGQSAFYVPILIEAVAIDGLDGALSGVAIFVVGLAVIEGAGTLLAHQPFAWTTVLIWSLIMLVVGASLAAVDQISFAVGAGRAATDALPNGEPGRPGIRLSPREQEVLKLIAEGNSNAMIAERLHLSETTVKSYVENLLTRLSVRNRAEAVAAAARLRIL